MKLSLVVSQKSEKISPINVKHISSSLEPSLPFHSLVTMVDSEDITLEKIKTQEFSLENNALSDTFNENATVTDNPSETSDIQALNRNK